MVAYKSLPATGHEVTWLSSDDAVNRFSSEVSLRWENEAWTAQGTLGVDNAQFVLRIGANWTIQQCLLFRDMQEPDLWLGVDRHHRWGEVNGAHRLELDGCSDVDFVNTPFTNCIPIRRLPLQNADSATISVAVIDITTLEVTKSTQQYTKVDSQTWRYFSLAKNQTVEVSVDEFGFVIDEPKSFYRPR